MYNILKLYHFYFLVAFSYAMDVAFPNFLQCVIMMMFKFTSEEVMLGSNLID